MLVSGRVVARSFGRRVSEYPLFHDTPSTHGNARVSKCLRLEERSNSLCPLAFGRCFGRDLES